MRLKGCLGVMAVLVSFANPAVAQEEDVAPGEGAGESPQTLVRSERSHADFDVKADGSYTLTIENVVVPLTAQAVRGLGQQRFSFREDVSTLEILEAYTLKQDGRRLDVPADRIRIVAPPYAAQAPIFSALKAKVIIFPDVAVGDRLVAKTRMHMHTPDFSEHFATANVFRRSRVYQDARVSIRYPQAMPLRFDVRGLNELASEAADGFTRRTWTFANLNPVPEEQGAVDPWDREPRFVASTFRDWSSVAKAYQERAEPMAAVSPAIRKMADEITAGLSQPRDQAKALYQWVAQNIRYVAVYLGAGGFVPHSAEAILANRYGDCKDHVTLLEALLAAKGIRSSPVLVHTGRRFEPSPLPTPYMFNHAITWLPDLNIYADSTARFFSFGVLPQQEMDKPVLHTLDGSALSRTPLNPQQLVIVNRLEMKVADDGSAVGKATILGIGAFAGTYRAQLASVDNEQTRPRFIEAMLKSAGLVGTAQLTKDDSTKLTDEYRYGIEFTAQDWLRTDAAGGLTIPSGLFSNARIANAVGRLSRPVETIDQPCGPMTVEEHTTIELPKTLKLGKAPANVTFDDPIVQYTATYSLKETTLTAQRKLVYRIQRGVCTPEELAAYRKVAEQIRKDMRTQVVYEAT